MSVTVIPNKITKEAIEAKIKAVDYYVLPETTVTVCVIHLENGFTVRGDSACVDPDNFDRKKGEHYAYEQAFDKIWQLEGYLLKQQRYEGETASLATEGEHDYNGSACDFGAAISALKQGHRVARAGWNGQGMFAYYVPANSYPAQTGVAKAFFGENALVPYRAYMALKTVDGSVATWTPSGSDVLADDWIILAD